MYSTNEKPNEMENLYNSLFDLKEVYKLLYDISKSLRVSIDYETIKLICYNFKEPSSKEETFVYEWLQIFYICYLNRVHIHSKYEQNEYVKRYQSLDHPNYIRSVFEKFSHESKFEQGTLLIILSILISKNEGIIFRYFDDVFHIFDIENINYIADYLEGFIETFKCTAPKRKKLSQVLTILKDNIAFFKKEKIKSLFLFGSIVKGSHTSKSDIDLLVYFDDIPSFEKEIHCRKVSSHISNILDCGCDIVEEKEVLYDTITDAIRTSIRIF